MNYKYIEAFAVRGLIGPKLEQLLISDGNFTAYLASNPDERLAEVDKRMALANLILTTVFNDVPDGMDVKKVEEKVSEIRNDRSKNKDAYFILEIIGELHDYKPEYESATGLFRLVSDSVIRDQVKSLNEDCIRAALITLPLLSEEIVGINRVTQGLILFDNNGSVIYPFHFKPGSATMYVSRQLDNRSIESASSLFKQLKEHKELERVLRLLTSSLQSGNDMLRAFLSGFTGLEIFVNKLFQQFRNILSIEIGNGRKPNVNGVYLNEVLKDGKDQYSLLDKFCVISIVLDFANANEDSILFMKVKKQRNLLTHGENIKDEQLNVANTRRLLIRYLNLFINFKKSQKN